MLKLFTGNINEALQSIKPDVYLNIADVRGTGVHPLSNVYSATIQNTTKCYLR